MSSAIRGNIAGFLANLNSDSDSDEDSGVYNGTNKQVKKVGIYASILSETKREVKNTHEKFDLAESKISTKFKLPLIWI